MFASYIANWLLPSNYIFKTITRFLKQPIPIPYCLYSVPLCMLIIQYLLLMVSCSLTSNIEKHS